MTSTIYGFDHYVEGELIRHLRAIERGDKPFPGSEAKRQHFVSRFLLDGFSDQPGKDEARLCQLELSSGKPIRVKPAEAASRRRFYTVPAEAGGDTNVIEAFLSLVEGHAAPALGRLLADPTGLGGGDRQTLSIFLALQGTRTPSGIARMASGVETINDLMIETMTASPEGFRASFREAIEDSDRYSDEEIERQRQWMIEAHQDGRIRMSNARTQGLTLMLTTTDATAQHVYGMSWEVLHAREGEFVTSDHPLAMFDPTPRFPWSGSAWESSPQAETTFPLNPTTCLLFHPGQAMISAREASVDEVEEINLRTYGFAQQHLFGRTQHGLTELRRLAKRKPGRVARPRFNYQVILEEADPSDPEAGAENVARGWPRFLEYPDPDGRPRTMTYEVLDYPQAS